MKKYAIITAKLIAFALNSILQTGILAIALAIIITLAIIIDPTFTQNNTGTDMLSAYGYVLWINRFFPHVPFWYPLQGAGVSFMAGYQWLSFMIVIAVHKLTAIPIFPIFNTLRFISFPITAVGIFIYCWTRLGYPRQAYIRQLIGVIAAIFYLIAPTTWYWSYKWGFYAESVSIMFIPYTLIFVDWFVDLNFKGDTSIKKRLALAGGIICYILAFLTHFGAGFSLTHIIPLMIITRCIYELRTQKVLALKTAITTGITFFLLFGILFAWRLVPYLEYTHQSKVGGYAGDLFVKETSTEPNRPTLKQLTQLEYLYQPDYRFIFNEFSIPLSLWIFAGFAILLGPFRTQKLLYLGITSAFGFIAYTYIEDLSFVYIRSLWTLFRVVIPLVAAYGAFSLGDALLSILDFLFKHTLNGINYSWRNGIRPLIGIGLTAISVYAVIYQVEIKNSVFFFNLPPRDTMILQKSPIDSPIFRIANNRQTDLRDIWDKPKPIPADSESTTNRARFNFYDPGQLELACNANDKQDPLFNNTCDEFILTKTLSSKSLENIRKFCSTKKRSEIIQSNNWCINFYLPIAYQLKLSNWPEIKFTEPTKSIISAADNNFFSHIPEKPLDTRFDLSAKTGSMIMQAPILTNNSESQVYVHELNLFAALWNYQSSVMYADQPINQKPGVISELAKYFGYEYILAITSSDNALNLYKNDPNWGNITLRDKAGNENKDWWKFKYPTTLTSWTSKPAVLFITDGEHYLYDQAFKTANLGVIPYDKAIIYNGNQYLDDYSKDELQKFDLLYLEGYRYHNQQNAYKLLNEYIKNGGSLFIDTGWQYNNPDWQLKDAPEFFPSNQFSWKEVGQSAHLILDDVASINYSSDQKDIGPIALPPAAKWGVSVANDVRNDSHVLVQFNNNPIVIAKKHGKGKVIWSGMNNIMHIEGGKNENTNEIALLEKSISWLLEKSSEQAKELKVSVTRSNPDEVKFKLNESTEKYTTLYFRESYYPLWSAYIQSETKGKKDLPVFSAGPRFIGIRVPPTESDSTVTLYIKPSFLHLMLNALATTTFICLMLYILGIIKTQHMIPNFIKTKRKMYEIHEDMSMKMHEDPNEETPNDNETEI